MNKLIKGSSILLYFLSAFVFFFIGTTVGVITGAAEGQGLAGAAIILFYGFVASILAIVAALFLAYNAETERIIRLNKLLGIGLAIFVIVATIRFVTRDKNKDPVKSPGEPTQPAPTNKTPVQLMSFHQPIPQPTKTAPGMGFYKPNFFEKSALYFYGNINIEKSIMEHNPTDSMTFARNQIGHYEIQTAPPWLVPAHMKMDYDLFLLRIKSIGDDFVELVVNETNGQTAFADKRAGKLLLWPDFLLTVNSVEFAEGIENKVHIKPLSNASTVNASYEFMQPTADP